MAKQLEEEKKARQADKQKASRKLNLLEAHLKQERRHKKRCRQKFKVKKSLEDERRNEERLENMRKQVKAFRRRRGVVEKLLGRSGFKNERYTIQALTDDMARENKRIEALLRKELADAQNKVSEVETTLNESLLQERQLHDKI